MHTLGITKKTDPKFCEKKLIEYIEAKNQYFQQLYTAYISNKKEGNNVTEQITALKNLKTEITKNSQEFLIKNYFGIPKERQDKITQSLKNLQDYIDNFLTDTIFDKTKKQTYAITISKLQIIECAIEIYLIDKLELTKTTIQITAQFTDISQDFYNNLDNYSPAHEQKVNEKIKELSIKLDKLNQSLENS